MGREKLALLLAALLITVSLWNIRRADKLCQSILAELVLVQLDAAEGEWDKAESSMGKALGLWLNAENYTHIFIRHTEIDSCTDSFYEAYGAVLSKADELPSRLQALRYHLDSIAAMEHISLGNIF